MPEGSESNHPGRAVSLEVGRPPLRIAVVTVHFDGSSDDARHVHNRELSYHLAKAGYVVRLFHAGPDNPGRPCAHPADGESFPTAGHLSAEQVGGGGSGGGSGGGLSDCTAVRVQSLFRERVCAFAPACVIVSDWTRFHPLLAEAVQEFPYILREHAMESVCPQNGLRLLPETGQVYACSGNQLSAPERCRRCVEWNQGLPRPPAPENQLCASLGAAVYNDRLHQAFRLADDVFAPDESTHALLAPYAPRVRCVP